VVLLCYSLKILARSNRVQLFWFLGPFSTEIFESSNCYLPKGNEAIDYKDVVGRGSEQYLLGGLSTIA
jgi:hypothetical protein